MKPPRPAAMIIQMGEKPNSQMSRAETIGIHTVVRVILADLAMLKYYKKEEALNVLYRRKMLLKR